MCPYLAHTANRLSLKKMWQSSTLHFAAKSLKNKNAMDRNASWLENVHSCPMWNKIQWKNNNLANQVILTPFTDHKPALGLVFTTVCNALRKRSIHEQWKLYDRHSLAVANPQKCYVRCLSTYALALSRPELWILVGLLTAMQISIIICI